MRFAARTGSSPADGFCIWQGCCSFRVTQTACLDGGETYACFRVTGLSEAAVVKEMLKNIT